MNLSVISGNSIHCTVPACPVHVTAHSTCYRPPTVPQSSLSARSVAAHITLCWPCDILKSHDIP